MCSITQVDQVDPNILAPGNYNLASDHTIVVSVPYPHGSIRAVSSRAGTLWELDCVDHLDLPGSLFNPCSVSASETGDVYIADRGTNRVPNSH